MAAAPGPPPPPPPSTLLPPPPVAAAVAEACAAAMAAGSMQGMADLPLPRTSTLREQRTSGPAKGLRTRRPARPPCTLGVCPLGRDNGRIRSPLCRIRHPPCQIWSGRSSLGWRRRGAGLPHRCAVAGSQSRSGAPSAFLTGSAPSSSWLLPSPSGARLPPPHFSGGLAGLLAGHAATAGGGSRRPPVACWCGVGARLPLVPRRRGQRTRSPSGQRSRRSSAARRAGGQSRRPAREQARTLRARG